MAIITLTTDFGVDDPYVAVMKGVILSIDPDAHIIDICHTVKPQDIAQAAYILSTTHRYYPQGSIHIAVVDPGVGTGRQAVLMVTPQGFFIGPDNGVLGYVVEESLPDAQAIALTNNRYWLTPVSSTFHGRDIFAPVAAHLSQGVSPSEFGEAVPSIATILIPRPQIGEDGVLKGRVIHVDRFGNLITDIREPDLPEGRLFVEVGGHIIADLSPSYEEGEELLAIMGSESRLEVSVKNGSAARFLKSKVGDEVKVGINKASLKGRFRR
jgi:S-adenosylmethionine hydrolase